MVRNQPSFHWPYRSLSTFLNKYKSFIKTKELSLNHILDVQNDQEESNELIKIIQKLIQELEFEETYVFDQLERNLNLIINEHRMDLNEEPIQREVYRTNLSSEPSMLQNHQNLATFFRQNDQLSTFVPLAISEPADDFFAKEVEPKSITSLDSIEGNRNSISNILRKRLQVLQTDHSFDSDNESKDSEDTLETLSSTQLDQQPYQFQNQKRNSKLNLQDLLLLDNDQRESLLLQNSWDSSDQFQLINDILMILGDLTHSKS